MARVEAIPRLKRNQPDAVLLATRFTKQLAASPDAKPAVAAVAFVWFLNYWNLLGWRY